MEFKCKNWLDRIVVIARGIGLIILYMVMSVFLSLIISKLSFMNNTVGKTIGLIASETILCGILVLLFLPRIKHDFKEYKSDFKKYLKIAFSYWVVGFIIMMISNIVINVFINSGGLAANETANREVLGKYPLYSILAMCILAPISEELLFRASFKPAFKNAIFYACFTGLFFAGMHVASGIDFTSLSSIIKNYKELLYFIPYGALGISFGLAFFKTDNIFTSISMHIFHNSLSVLMILLSMLAG